MASKKTPIIVGLDPKVRALMKKVYEGKVCSVCQAQAYRFTLVKRKNKETNEYFDNITYFCHECAPLHLYNRNSEPIEFVEHKDPRPKHTQDPLKVIPT